MRHRVAGRKLGRSRGQRRALYRNLIAELFRHDRIRTTEAKARAIRARVERLVTLAKRGDVHARRQVIAYLGGEPRISQDKTTTVVQKLFDDLAPRYADREGGYTRLFKLGRRKGDGAQIALIELVE